MKKILKNYFYDIKKMKRHEKVIFISLIILMIISLIIYTKITIFVLLAALLFIGGFFFFKNQQFRKQINGNGIIAGGRGKGKGLLLNKAINYDPNDKHFCNIPYNHKTEVINISEYVNSIAPITSFDFINNTIDPIPKIEKFEKVNIYWDEVASYAPNYMDHELKKLYPSLSALLPINRHAYDAFMIIVVQDFQRVYKLLRELQTDFAIKALETYGFKRLSILNAIPIVRHFVFTKYIYYDKIESAHSGLLPFNAKALTNEVLKHGYLTAGQATKETYEAQHGKIRYGWVAQRKSKLLYDTRYFHEVVFGVKAPKN